MKRPEEGQRWLTEAEEELETARWDLQGRRYSAACFWSQQAAEKALKAFLFHRGRRTVLAHSIAELAGECIAQEQAFPEFAVKGMLLDRYYVPTRYPNSLPFPAVPARAFSQQEAEDAVVAAETIVTAVRERIRLPETNRGAR